MARLQEIVAELEGDQVDLERSVQLYGEGRKLVEHCEKLLGVAEKALREAGNGAGPETESRATASASGEEFEDEIPF